MAGTSIRVSEELAYISKAESQLMQRSQAGQIEYWARIGRAIEHSGQFDYQHIAGALKGEVAVDQLTSYEKPVYDELHDEAMRDGSPAETRWHKQRIQAMRKAGVDIDSLGD